MAIKEIVEATINKHERSGIEINPPAKPIDIENFEKTIGFELSLDFKEFYFICDGFSCEEDIFNMIPLNDIINNGDYGKNWFYFSEYMIYSDTWGLRFMEDNKYEIFNGNTPEIVMTSSLEEFLQRFLEGNVFDKGGLFDWEKELRNKLNNL